ncbi:MAG: trigger factor [Lachnospiraceae bacterium]|nr:trigger factor [Lachnospiraceae bacterium]MCI9383584.1 trigger factor [Lachnospiraceae bacterium]MCI9624745.1 trigger factor [Lachnospiraceae bacterium]GFI10018.1 trigger factor [Lachnospiraceae bacterium]
MSLQVEKLEKNMAKLTIEVSAEELEQGLQKAYLKNKNRINVPGFRKGKVPRQMIEKMYGPEIFYEDAANALIPDAYAKAMDECELELVSRPVIDIVKIEKGQPFVFTAEVAVKPEVTLGAYKGIEVEKIDTAATEEEITAEVDKERDNNSRTITVEDRAVENGDMTVIDFEGFVDGTAFEGGKGTDYPLTIGSGAFIPGFEEQLVGAEIGREVDVNVTFPEEYHAKELAGKPAVFKCTVKEIKVKELPDADDEFVKDVSEFDTMEEYRADLKKKIEDRKAADAKAKKEDAVIEKIIEGAQMEIPEAMIDTQAESLVDDFAQRLMMQGMSLEQYAQYTGATVESMKNQMKPQAKKRIESRLVLEAVAAAENLEASEEDIEAEMNRMAESCKMELDKLKELISEEEKKNMRQDLSIQKAIELVTEAAVEK